MEVSNSALLAAFSVCMAALQLPFEPPNAFDSLEKHIPSFIVRLSWPDVREYVVHGHVSRKFVLHGRFPSFDYTMSMRSDDEMTVDSLLNSRIPKTSVSPLYNGEAIGCECFSNYVHEVEAYLRFWLSSPRRRRSDV